MIIFLIFCLLFIFFTAKIDAEHIIKEEYIHDHTSRLIQRMSVGMLLINYNYEYPVILWCLFWTFFDSILNILRKKPLLYLGTESEYDSFFGNKKLFFIFTKIVTFSIVLLIILNNLNIIKFFNR